MERASPRRRSGLLVVLLLGAAAWSPLFAFGKNKINYNRFDWRVYKAPHFDMYYYPEEESKLEQMVSYAESAYVHLSQALDHEIKFRIPLIFYKTHGEFEQTNITLEFIPEFVAAFAEPFENRMVLPADRPPDLLYQLIAHELTHVFEYSILYQESISRAIRANTPLWLMEGLAEHLSGENNPLSEMVVRDAVVHNIIPPIHRVNQLSFLTYRFGQAAFDFIESKYGQEGIRNFLWEYRKVLLTNNLEKPIREAFGVDADEFDRQFRRYLQAKYLGLYLGKKEPEDYGKEIGIKLEGIHTFSPTLSPSGDLVAALTNRYDDLDVVIFSAKDGEMIRNVTKGFTNKYDQIVAEAFDGERDLSWSAEGDRVAFFARKENERLLLIYDALKGKELDKISIPGIDVESSPCFSPDGASILFSGNKAGVVDIYKIELATRTVTPVTQDEFDDSNPTWSPDGKWILFNRRINQYEKLFMVDATDTSRMTQLTFGETSDLMPAVSRDGKTLYYVSDAGPERIFNLYTLSLVDGETRRYTDVIGGFFAPQELSVTDGKAAVALTTFYQGRYRLFRVELGEPLSVVKAGDDTPEPPELEPFEPPLKLALDEKEKQPYRIKWHLESNPSVLIGVANDGTVLSNAQIHLADLLGDHRILLNFQSVSTFSNIDLQYWNLRHRWQYGFRALDFRDFYAITNINGDVDVRQATRTSGVSAQISYPFSLAYRVEASFGLYMRSLERPFYQLGQDASGNPTVSLEFDVFSQRLPFVTFTWSGDTTRFKEFGAYHGKRFQFTTVYSPYVSGDGAPFTEYYVDYRAYGRLTKRSLFAWRLYTSVSESTGVAGLDGSTIYSYGGYNQLRGYDYRQFFGNRVAYTNIELRFPLIDELRFPFGALQMLRAFFFFDMGSAWFQGDRYYDEHTFSGDPNYQGLSLIEESKTNPGVRVLVPRPFEFWDDKNGMLADGRATWGFGFAWYLGPFELTWTWAKRFENSILVPVDTNNNGIPNFYERVPDPRFDDSVQSSFYIGTSF